jgi:hypothetical protein
MKACSKSDELLKTRGFTYKDLLNLQNVGLIESGEVELYVEKEKPLSIHYFDEKFMLSLNAPSTDGQGLHVTVLSKTGQELAPICGATREQDYIETLNQGMEYFKIRTQI